MNEIRYDLLSAISEADFKCRCENGCRNATDCGKCKFLKTGCIKGYIADKLLEQFSISPRETLGGADNG